MEPETTQTGGGGAGCWKRGCLGCLLLVGLSAAAFLILGFLMFMGEPPEPDYENRELTQELPALPGGEGATPGEPAGPEMPPGDGSQDAEALPGGSGEPGDTIAVVARPVLLSLDLSMGRFIIEPGPAGEPLRVEADYDRRSFELTESFDAGSREYRLRFRSKVSFLRLLRLGDVRNEVRLIVPRGYPIELEGEIGKGESRIDLGGLWVTAVDLELGAGSHNVEFSEPLARPADRVAFDASFGELVVDSLGNASPAEVEVSHSMGSLRLDLEGAWRQDCRVDVQCGFGECHIRAPAEDVAFVVERASVTFGERSLGQGVRREAPAGAPTVRLKVQGTAGEVRVH